MTPRILGAMKQVISESFSALERLEGAASEPSVLNSDPLSFDDVYQTNCVINGKLWSQDFPINEEQRYCSVVNQEERRGTVHLETGP